MKKTNDNSVVHRCIGDTTFQIFFTKSNFIVLPLRYPLYQAPGLLLLPPPPHCLPLPLLPPLPLPGVDVGLRRRRPPPLPALGLLLPRPGLVGAHGPDQQEEGGREGQGAEEVATGELEEKKKILSAKKGCAEIFRWKLQKNDAWSEVCISLDIF